MFYRNIQTSFWRDAKVSNTFTPEDKYFYLFLLTTPDGNQTGAFEFSFSIAANYLGYDQETVKKLLKRFEEIHEIIIFDEVSSEILIKNYHKYNWSSSNTFLKGIEKTINELKSEKIKQFLIETIKNTYPNYTLSIPYAYPMDRVKSPPHTPPLRTSISNRTSTSINTYGQKSDFDRVDFEENDVNFDAFWELYPKKIGKTVCKKWFERKKVDQDLFKKMIDALKKQITSIEWTKDKGKYIPNPSTWLNRGGWEDELTYIDERKAENYEAYSRVDN